jgi:biopolymer transport protein ExbD
MQTRRVSLSLVQGLITAAIVLVALASCVSHEVPRVVRLEVSSLGTYTVNGSPVERDGLAEALLLHKREGEDFLVHVVPSQGAGYAAVYAAVEAVQRAGGSVGMVGNVAFYPASQSSGARP